MYVCVWCVWEGRCKYVRVGVCVWVGGDVLVYVSKQIWPVSGSAILYPFCPQALEREGDNLMTVLDAMKQSLLSDLPRHSCSPPP